MKIMIYNIKRCPREEMEKQLEKKSLRKTTPEGRTPGTWIYYFSQAEDDFIPYLHKHSSKPSTIVTSFLNSYQFFLPRSTNLLFGLVRAVSNPVLESKPKLVLTETMQVTYLNCFYTNFGFSLVRKICSRKRKQPVSFFLSFFFFFFFDRNTEISFT